MMTMVLTISSAGWHFGSRPRERVIVSAMSCWCSLVLKRTASRIQNRNASKTFQRLFCFIDCSVELGYCYENVSSLLPGQSCDWLPVMTVCKYPCLLWLSVCNCVSFSRLFSQSALRLVCFYSSSKFSSHSQTSRKDIQDKTSFLIQQYITVTSKLQYNPWRSEAIARSNIHRKSASFIFKVKTNLLPIIIIIRSTKPRIPVYRCQLAVYQINNDICQSQMFIHNWPCYPRFAAYLAVAGVLDHKRIWCASHIVSHRMSWLGESLQSSRVTFDVLPPIDIGSQDGDRT